jgi:hypothetical protein
MSERGTAETGWPWQVSAAFWLFLADVLGLFLTGTKIVSVNTATDNALDPLSPGGGYLGAADFLLSTAFTGLLIVICLAALGLILIVWKFRGWTRHLMALFSAAFLILALLVGGMPHGFPVYAICFGLITLPAAGLIYTDAAETWFDQPKAVAIKPAFAVAKAGLEMVTPVAPVPRGQRPTAVSSAAGCLAEFLALMFVGWSSDKNTVMAPGEADFFYIFDLIVVLTLALIPYGLWHGVPVARKIATPFCLVSGFFLLFYIWGPDLLNCMMLVLAVSCVIFLHRRGVREWFNAA